MCPELDDGLGPVESHGTLAHALMRATLPGMALMIRPAEQVREGIPMGVRAVRYARSGAHRHRVRHHDS